MVDWHRRVNRSTASVATCAVPRSRATGKTSMVERAHRSGDRHRLRIKMLSVHLRMQLSSHRATCPLTCSKSWCSCTCTKYERPAQRLRTTHIALALIQTIDEWSQESARSGPTIHRNLPTNRCSAKRHTPCFTAPSAGSPITWCRSNQPSWHLYYMLSSIIQLFTIPRILVQIWSLTICLYRISICFQFVRHTKKIYRIWSTPNIADMLHYHRWVGHKAGM